MIQNTHIRQAVKKHLRDNIPDKPPVDGSHVWATKIYDHWAKFNTDHKQIIMIYMHRMNNQQGKEQSGYIDDTRKFAGSMIVQMVLDDVIDDAAADELAERVSELLPINMSLPAPASCRIDDIEMYEYERSPDTNIRAINFYLPFQWN